MEFEHWNLFGIWIFASATSAFSSAMERRMNTNAITHTNGKNSTPSTSHVSVKPKTRVAMSSGA